MASLEVTVKTEVEVTFEKVTCVECDEELEVTWDGDKEKPYLTVQACPVCLKKAREEAGQ